jgi:hypothetical protein
MTFEGLPARAISGLCVLAAARIVEFGIGAGGSPLLLFWRNMAGLHLNWNNGLP